MRARCMARSTRNSMESGRSVPGRNDLWKGNPVRVGRGSTWICGMEIYSLGREGSEMFCTQCGNEVEQHAQFCSKCGQAVTAAAAAAAKGPAPAALPAQKKTRDMDMHVNILGWLLVGSGVLTGMFALIVLFAGQVFRHLPIPLPPDMPFGVPHFVGWI